MIAKGGQSVYGAPLGILMLEAKFPRIPGEMGHAGTWPFPVRYKVVRGASPDQVVRRQAEGLLDDFIAAGRELVEDGCKGITTNCGFLTLFQDDLSEALGVPVATSALMQASMIQSMLPRGRHVGILTISAGTLTKQHLTMAHVPEGTPVMGVAEGCEFQRVILGNELELDVAKAEADMVEAATRLVKTHPDTGAILLECTNMPPYARAVKEAVGLPVFSVISMVKWFYEALD